eukprot:Nk52_evm25s2426 gene=Nk52_evmTU25s2426
MLYRIWTYSIGFTKTWGLLASHNEDCEGDDDSEEEESTLDDDVEALDYDLRRAHDAEEDPHEEEDRNCEDDVIPPSELLENVDSDIIDLTENNGKSPKDELMKLTKDETLVKKLRELDPEKNIPTSWNKTRLADELLANSWLSKKIFIKEALK